MLLLAAAAAAQDAPWRQYTDLERAGWSTEQLARARSVFDSLDSSALMLVHEGVVVVAWGDVERRFMCHSVRKSVLSALFGEPVKNGTIDLGVTLAELDIDDVEPRLTAEERQATVRDLLAARSGIYRRAAYEDPAAPKPERGSHPPGTHWCYNNWDFNALATVFERTTGARVFDEITRRLARPLGMQDFRARDGYYHFETDKSAHPAYPLRMSARDLARFGVLFEQEGAWSGRQVLPAEWVRESTTAVSENVGVGGYGYMWWTFEGSSFEQFGMYAALGTGGQCVAVLPEIDMVIVHLSDTYLDHDVSLSEIGSLLKELLRAKVSVGADDLVTGPLRLPPRHSPKPAVLPPGTLTRLEGTYEAYGKPLHVTASADGLTMFSPAVGTFDLVPLSPTEFWVEDLEQPLRFLFEDGGPRPIGVAVEWFLSDHGAILLSWGEVDEAVAVLETDVARFPDAARPHVRLAQALLARGERDAARGHVERALALEPDRADARAVLESLQERR